MRLDIEFSAFFYSLKHTPRAASSSGARSTVKTFSKCFHADTSWSVRFLIFPQFSPPSPELHHLLLTFAQNISVVFLTGQRDKRGVAERFHTGPAREQEWEGRRRGREEHDVFVWEAAGGYRFTVAGLAQGRRERLFTTPTHRLLLPCRTSTCCHGLPQALSIC